MACTKKGIRACKRACKGAGRTIACSACVYTGAKDACPGGLKRIGRFVFGVL